MALTARAELNLVRVGVAAGLTAVVTYLLKNFLHLPAALETAFFIYRGPLMAAAFVGFYPFLQRPTPSAATIFGTVFGVIAGACSMLFAVIQMVNLHDIRPYIRAAESPAEQEAWQNIFRGVFTVQNGINYTYDFFLDLAAFMYAIVMWNHPKFGKAFSVLSLILVGPHFVMKAITFPTPPAEAGLFDAGPLVSVWFLLVIIWVARHLRWMEERTQPAR